MHSSCVNAITFSGDGRWLASAGDGTYTSPILVLKYLTWLADPYVYLWDFHQDSLDKPSHAFRGPRVSPYEYPSMPLKG